MTAALKMRFPIRITLLLMASATIAAAAEEATRPETPGPLRVATFNIRLGSANDGEDRWQVRRERTIEAIRGLNADILGLQEAEPFQTRALLEALPQYFAVGVSREDGRIRGEACPLLVDRTRFAVAESGVFWLSDRPDEPGSITWDNVCPRLCTWARLIDRRSGRGCVVYNTHLDHVGQASREKAAEQIRAHFLALAARRASGANAGGIDPLIVMGDFNSGEDNPVVARLRGPADDPLVLRDSYRVIHPDGAAGTFTRFDLASAGGPHKIDYVWIGLGWTVHAADIDRRKVNGRWPSDHFPVWAELEWE
jgi:endonuclease/exonuclease/phosphatase family metal-dependent hydrolase